LGLLDRHAHHEDVTADMLVELADREIVRLRVDEQDAGVVHQNVETAETADRLVNAGMSSGFFRDIRCKCDRLTAGRPDRGGDILDGIAG
jgi:hypothetical protein